MLNGSQSVGVAPVCSHANAQSSISTEPKGVNFETHISFTCPDCGAVATIFAAGGPVNKGRILWSWNPPPPKAEPRQHNDAAAQPHVDQQKPDPKKGLPGTEMLKLTAELGITSPPACGCKSTAAMMDRLGLEESRARVADFKVMIAANWANWGWKDKLSAVTAAAWKGAGLGVNPTDPVRDLLEIAFERTEAEMLKAKDTP